MYLDRTKGSYNLVATMATTSKAITEMKSRGSKNPGPCTVNDKRRIIKARA